MNRTMRAGRRMGFVLAGGASRRFGSDKAIAMVDGATMIDRAVAALRPHCDAVGIVGRTHSDLPSVPDRPRAGLGPLGGLAGALAAARDVGGAEVLTVPCDVPFPPDDLFAALDHGPAIIADHPVFGLWPTSLADRLERWLADDRPRAVRAFAAAVDARLITIDMAVRDVDTPADLAALA